MKDKTPRQLARLAGEKTYTSKDSCVKGHSGPRYVSSGGCIECLEERTESGLFAEQRRLTASAHYYANKEKCSARSIDWARRNRDKVNARRNEWFRENYRELHDKNKEAWAVVGRNRRCRLSGAGGRHTKQQIKEMLEAQDFRCNYCKIFCKYSYHVDHVKPVAKGGTNDISNIQILCATCNQVKGSKYPYTYRG